MTENARNEEYEAVELFGKSALFTNNRLDRSTVPDGLFCYDLRGSDFDPGMPSTVEKAVGVNHAAAVITAEPIDLAEKGYRSIKGKLNFLGESMTLAEFCRQHCPEPEQGMKMEWKHMKPLGWMTMHSRPRTPPTSR
jgi:hypothetical protein